ncbi:MAG: hypothetical protein RR382_12815 [Tannerellaceae bacterium]
MQSVYRAIRHGNAIITTETKLNAIGVPETVATGVVRRKGTDHKEWSKLKRQNDMADKTN